MGDRVIPGPAGEGALGSGRLSSSSRPEMRPSPWVSREQGCPGVGAGNSTSVLLFPQSSWLLD